MMQGVVDAAGSAASGHGTIVFFATHPAHTIAIEMELARRFIRTRSSCVQPPPHKNARPRSPDPFLAHLVLTQLPDAHVWLEEHAAPSASATTHFLLALSQ